ncbi:MAG: 5'-nucleotidase C-terminal domain-containing protein, partial [Candidatus Cloacimonadota bacterium]|nr:5'-nucleotidase C-terminal domain-containing protein [Candidatus Cloacimonadota bacterium]
VEANNEPFANLPSFKIVKRDGISIGFIGLTDAMSTTIAKSVLQKDLLPSAKQTVEKLKNLQTDLIIAITQTGKETNEKLLEKIPEIDAIFSEEMYENRTNVYYVGDRPIITTCGNLGSIARLDIKETGGKTSFYLRIYPVDSSVKEQKNLAELQQKYQDKLEKDLAKPIAILQHPLNAGVNGDFKCRWGETNVGNLITDSYRKFHDADIAILNGGGIRANASAGEFTIKDALSIIPFGNRICLVEISGNHIWEALEYGVGSVEKSGGNFLQISGSNYEYDWSKKRGERLLRVDVAGKPLEMDKIYTLSLPDYLLFGGDGFDFLDHCKIIVPPESASKDIEVFIEYCKKQIVLEPKIENRIGVKNKE